MVSGLNDRNRKDYSKYDKMSTESLEELLRLDAELSEGEDSDIDEILYISEVIARREEERSPGRFQGTGVDAAWDIFQTKYRPYSTDGRSLYDFDDDEPDRAKAADSDAPSPPRKKHFFLGGKRRFHRLVSFAAAVLMLFGLMTVTAYSMGFDLWGVIAQWSQDTFTFVPASKVSGTDNSYSGSTPIDAEYADLQTALDAYGITEPLAPTWVPEGFIIEAVGIDEDIVSMVNTFHVSYICDERWIIVHINMHQTASDAIYWAWEKDDINVIETQIEGCTFYIMENAGRQCAVWSNGPFECSITGDITSEELYKVIKSIFVRNE